MSPESGEEPPSEERPGSTGIVSLDVAVRGIKNGDGTLAVVDLSGQSLGDDGASSVAAAFTEAGDSCAVATLNLSRNGISGSGAAALAKALFIRRSFRRSLRKLVLDDNDITSAGAGALASALRGSRFVGAPVVLATLSLNGNPRIRCKGARLLAEGLRSDTALTTLGLDGCGIGDTGAARLARSLIQPTGSGECAVRELRLGSNMIGDEGAKVLGAALSASHSNVDGVGGYSLRVLNLRGNVITAAGALHLGRAIRPCNCPLDELDVGDNELGLQGAAHLVRALLLAGEEGAFKPWGFGGARSKLGISRVDMSDNGLTEDEMTRLEDVILDTSVRLGAPGLPHVAVLRETESMRSTRLAAVKEESRPLIRNGEDWNDVNAWNDVNEAPLKEEAEYKLKEDIFTFLFVSRTWGRAFNFAFSVYAIQVFLLILILMDQIDLDSQSNPLSVPGQVRWQVTAAQLIAIIIAIPFQDDLLEAIGNLHDGYHPDTPLFVPEANRWKFYLSTFCSFTQGALYISVLFFIIVTSEAVLGLFLNFAALQFISELDDVAFKLIRNGLLFPSLQEKAREVQTIRLPVKATPNLFCRRSFLVAVGFTFLFSGWLYIVIKQYRGVFLRTGLVSMEVVDDANPEMELFSGIYRLDEEWKQASGQSRYVNEHSSGLALIAYCSSEKAWTLSVSASAEEKDPCSWVAKSPETDSYDVMTVSQYGWLSYRKGGDHVPVEHMSIFSVDCTKNKEDFCGGPEHGFCNVESKLCECVDGSFGLRCQFVAACPELFINKEANEYLMDYYGEQDNFFHYESSETFRQVFKNASGISFLMEQKHSDRDIELVKVNERPLYIRENKQAGFPEIIMFVGKRWVYTDSLFLNDLQGVKSDVSSIVQFLSTEFHSHWSAYNIFMFSDPEEIGRNTISVTPVGLTWQFSDPRLGGFATPSEKMPSLVSCALCNDDDSPCRNLGRCEQDVFVSDGLERFGHCSCFGDTNGFLCEERIGSECQTANGTIIPDCECGEGCHICDENGLCRTCLDGSEVQLIHIDEDVGCCGPNCKQCHDSCETCGRESNFGCLSCSDRFKIEVKFVTGEGCCGQACNQCHDTCATCGVRQNDPNDCITCGDGYDFKVAAEQEEKKRGYVGPRGQCVKM